MSVALGRRGIRTTRPNNPNLDMNLLIKTNPFKYATRGQGQFYASQGEHEKLSGAGEHDERPMMGADGKTNTPMKEMEVMSGGAMGDDDEKHALKLEKDVMKVVRKVLNKKKNHTLLNKGISAEDYGKLLGKGFAGSVYRRHIYPKIHGKAYTYDFSTKKGEKEFEEDHKMGAIDKLILRGLKWGWGKIKKAHQEGRRKKKVKEENERRAERGLPPLKPHQIKAMFGGGEELSDEEADNLIHDEDLEGGSHGRGRAKARAFFGGLWKGIKTGAKVASTVAPFIL